MTARVTILASDLAALERIAAKGYRVIVEGQGVRRVVEPVDSKPDDVQASGGEDAAAQEPGRWR